MRTSDNFYVETAKFALALVGGGTAGFLIANGVKTVASKVGSIASMKFGPKILSRVMGGNDQSGEQTEPAISL